MSDYDADVYAWSERQGALLRRIEGPAKAALGDMALDSNGNAIVCDGQGGGVYRVGRSAQRFERIVSMVLRAQRNFNAGD